jgi:hypothetical protein
MIRNALTGEPKADPDKLKQEQDTFTSEGAPPPGHVSPTPPDVDKVDDKPAKPPADSKR